MSDESNRLGGYFWLITDRTIIVNAYYRVRELMETGGKQVDQRIGVQGGSKDAVLLWRSDLGIWSCFEIMNHKYWNSYGIRNPTAVSNNDVVCQTNIAREGVNRSLGAGFVENSNRDVFLAHSGRIGGGREGIGMSGFWSEFDGPWINVVYPNGKPRKMAVVGQVNAPHFDMQLALFVHKVYHLKNNLVEG